MEKKPSGPRFCGKACVVSRDANEKIRFKMRDEAEIFVSLRKMLNSLGRGGKGGTSLSRDPFGPQQKPGFSPVNNNM